LNKSCDIYLTILKQLHVVTRACAKPFSGTVSSALVNGLTRRALICFKQVVTGSTMMLSVSIIQNVPRTHVSNFDATNSALRARLDRFLRDIERRALRMAILGAGHLDDAMELVQDSMLGFVKSYSDKPESDWAPLFFRVLDSRIQDHHRRQKVRGRWRVFFRNDADTQDSEDALAQVPDSNTPTPIESFLVAQASVAIDAALRALPDRQRQAFLLRIWEGLDVADTATAMGCSQGSVKTHLFRAMDALKRRLEDLR